MNTIRLHQKIRIEKSTSFDLSGDLEIIAFRVDYEKRWRHSYKATYVLYTTKYFYDADGGDEQKYLGEIENVWLFSFEPQPAGLRYVPHKFVCVKFHF